MQEEVNEKTVSLCITGGKVTVRLLKQAMMRFLAAMEKEKVERSRKQQQTKGPPDKEYHGKQSMKKLAQQNVQLSNIEITDNNIKAFEKVAKKYGIDFSLKRDKSVDPPRYFVFFKARDVDVMTAAFREFTGKTLNKAKKPSVRKKLQEAITARSQDKQREREKQKRNRRSQRYDWNKEFKEETQRIPGTSAQYGESEEGFVVSAICDCVLCDR